jgi:hypothetical protein
MTEKNKKELFWKNVPLELNLQSYNDQSNNEIHHSTGYWLCTSYETPNSHFKE